MFTRETCRYLVSTNLEYTTSCLGAGRQGGQGLDRFALDWVFTLCSAVVVDSSCLGKENEALRNALMYARQTEQLRQGNDERCSGLSARIRHLGNVRAIGNVCYFQDTVSLVVGSHGEHPRWCCVETGGSHSQHESEQSACEGLLRGLPKSSIVLNNARSPWCH